MKNRENLLFSILLVTVNTLGAVSALVYALQLNHVWRSRPVLFSGGIFLVCILSTLFWRKCDRRRLLIRGAVLVGVYGAGVLIFREKLLNSLGWGLSDAVAKLNSRYDIQLIWNWTPGQDEAVMSRAALLSLLVVLIPYILLLGYGVMRSRVIAIILADAVWFVAACGMDVFPSNGILVFCVLGLAGVVIKKAYRDDQRAGMWAAFLGMAVTGIIMALVYRFMLPVFDNRYEEILEARVELNRKINGEWIPKLKSSILRIGKEGVDVTGELTEKEMPVYTGAEVYRVTLDAAPKTAVYLRGFVGKDYAGNEWKPDRDSDFVKYYRTQKWELPEDGSKLVNLTYEAFRRDRVGYVRVEELGGRGSYSIYPYGAGMSEDYKVHWDGSAERLSSSYEFSYSAPENYDATEKLTGEWEDTERRYRSYVYDNFCEYPADQFPELTSFLEESGFRRGNFYDSLADVLSYLRRNATYNLEVGNPPSGKDFVEYFLFESHEGYCAHFASSAVLMLRYLGIPARYATGYSVSTDAFKREADGSYTAVITDRQAHAWAEVYLDGVGWIPVEMTPGAAAFAGDNTMEQLQLAGQLSGAFNGGEDAEPKDDRIPEDKEDISDKLPDAEAEEVSSEKPLQSKDPGETGSGSVAGDDSESDFVLWKNGKPEAKRWELSPGAKAVLKGMAWICAVLFFCFAAMYLTQRNCYRKLCRADNREKIFLLYRNLRVLLWVSGHNHRLDGEEEEVCAFRHILEKCSFGEKEPSEQELRRAMAFCRRLKKDEYGRLPFYRKLLFRCLNVYG